ncbi:S41 family peptidase [Chitinimonas naiadis]
MHTENHKRRSMQGANTMPLGRLFGGCALATMLAACGGGGGGTTGSGTGTGTTPPVSSVRAQTCSPNNPYRQDALAATSVGTLNDEKRWLQDYFDRQYLWYREVPVVNADASAYSDDRQVYNSLDNYFEALKTPALTASGKRRDAFSFTYPTRDWNALSQSGTSLGYGIEWYLSASKPPRGIRVAYVEPASPAAQAGVQRGDMLISADGIAADAAAASDVAALNAAMYPSGGNHGFVLSRAGNVLPAINLLASKVVRQPVLVSKSVDVAGQKVGYIAFNDHIAPAEQQLINAVTQLKADKITDLVLDLRYNGGGYLYIANELSYMIAGPGRVGGKVFETLQYNDKRTTDTARSRSLFSNVDCQLNASSNCTSSKPLPSLDLPRVYILTSASTCSASESIINGLRGADVEVQLIGSTTCGKPYGFVAKDNCGISYFPIEFVGSNAKGFGDYADGFAPTCAAKDDFNLPLGDVSEGLFAAALYKRSQGSCRPATAAMQQGGVTAGEGFLLRPPVRENRIVLP